MRFRHISESVLQEAWSNVYFRQDGLKTQSGSRVDIIKPGKLNRLSGPDFKEATIIIDGVLLHGDIELHVMSDDWERHNHHNDPAYNSVILHLALDYRKRPIKRKDHSEVPHVNIASRVRPSILSKKEAKNELPCKDWVRLNSELAQKQLHESADLYFDELVERHLQRIRTFSEHSNPYLMAVFAGFCSVLGMPGNREPMEAISTKIWNIPPHLTNQEILKNVIHSVSGWRLSTGRPKSRPEVRLNEAIDLASRLKVVERHPLHSLTVDECIALIWPNKSKTVTKEVMLATVLLPALWVAKSLRNDQIEAKKIRDLWKELPVPLSPEAQKFMWNNPVFVHRKWNKSLNWQYRSMCVDRKCMNCHLGRSLRNETFLDC